MITGRKVVLVEARREDMDAIRKIAAQCADWLFWDGGEISMDRLEQTLLATEAGTTSSLWSVWRAGEIIGFVTLNDIHPVHRSAEVRYLGLRADVADVWLFADVGKALYGFAFDRLNLNRLVCQHYARHTALSALYQHLGGTLEGTARQARWGKNGYEDLLTWAMLAQDWRALRDAKPDNEPEPVIENGATTRS